jgi:hypoxanthine-DNA glycosylase
MTRLRPRSKPRNLIPNKSSYFPRSAKRSKATTTDTTTHTVTRSLDPICNPSSLPHTLVLGTHPCKVSLNSKTTKTGAALEKFIQKRGGSGPQNYGNPANSFWNIAGSYLQFRRDQIKYEEQTRIWKDNSLALWDVVRSCSYKGDSSLDSKINMNTVVPNDIPSLLSNLPSLKRVVFPKTSSEMLKKKQCFKKLLSMPTPIGADYEFCVCTDGVAANETMKVFSAPNWIKAVVPLTTAQMSERIDTQSDEGENLAHQLF